MKLSIIGTGWEALGFAAAGRQTGSKVTGV